MPIPVNPNQNPPQVASGGQVQQVQPQKPWYQQAMDYAKPAYDWATTPLVSQETMKPVQDAIDSPSLTRSPRMAQLQGFGAGALEGLRGLTSPASIAGIAGSAIGAGGLEDAALWGGRAAEGASGALQGLSRATPAASWVADESMLPKAINSAGDLRGMWAEDSVNQAAKLRGMAGDVPNNPNALNLEAIRRSIYPGGQ